MLDARLPIERECRARMPRSSRASRIAAPGRGVRTANSWKKVARRRPGCSPAARRCARRRSGPSAGTARPPGAAPACPCRRDRSWRSVAQRAWLEQMLLVAFSRRICCSRAWKRQHIGAPPLAIHAGAGDTARHAAQQRLARGDVAHIGAAVGQGDAERLGVAHRDIGAPPRPARPAAPARAGWRR